jgi:hypothetical protein
MLLEIWNNLFKMTSLDFQNIMSMSVSIFSFYTILTEQNGNWNFWIMRAIMFCISLDMFINKKIDVYIHHICVLSSGIFSVITKAENDTCTYIITSSLRNTEISTFFLVLTYWIPKEYKIMNIINNIFFIITFVKYRVFNLLTEVIINDDVYSCIHPYTKGSIFKNVCFFGGIFILYALNLYWLTIIIKKLYKGIFSKVESYQLSEKILQYTYDLSIFISLYIYLYQTTKEQQYKFASYYYYDVVCIILLSFTSFLYHMHNYYNILNDGVSFNCAGKDVWIYILDNLAVRLRTFAVLYGNIMIRSSLGHNVNNLLFIAIMVNISSAIIISLYLFYLYKTKNYYSYDLSNTESIKHDKILSILGGIPIFISTFLMSMGLNDIKLITYNFLILYCLILISVIKPFYKMNHSLLHIGLMFQTWILCKINTSYSPIN